MGSAERRVADFVSANPGEVIHMSMARLSQACDVSDPTIMRFCRRFGFEGYQDFKLHLAQSLVPSAPFAYEQIVPGNSIQNVVRKTARNSLNAIQRLLEDLDPRSRSRRAPSCCIRRHGSASMPAASRRSPRSTPSTSSSGSACAAPP